MVTRERFIEASIDLFSHHGFDDTSLSAIGKKAGVTQPILNYHFGTKRELYRDVIRHAGHSGSPQSRSGTIFEIYPSSTRSELC